MLPWDGSAAQGLMDVKVSGKRPKPYGDIVRDLAVVVVRWRGMVNTLFDTADKNTTPEGANMVGGLTSRYGPASRIMWPAYERNKFEIENEIRDVCVEVMAQTNRRIAREKL
jgi:hypothetical protein